MVAPKTEALLVPSIPGVETPVFQGPLDLLLFLIRKNEIDIYDIPIEGVTRQYLDVLFAMEQLNLDLAGDFFVMAATLMQIKSRMLLPKKSQEVVTEEGEEPIDPRWELVQQLIEYKKVRESSEELEAIISQGEGYLPRQCKNSPEDLRLPLAKTSTEQMWSIFNTLLKEFELRVETGTIQAETVTLADRMEYILDKIERTESFAFTELFQKKESITVFVVTFLAILELVRMKKLHIEQETNYGEILCRSRDPEDIEEE